MDQWEVVRSWESAKKYLPGGAKWQAEQHGNIVRVDQLPFYPSSPERADLSDYRYVADAPLPLQAEISACRKFVQRRCDTVRRALDAVAAGVGHTRQRALGRWTPGPFPPSARSYALDDGGKAAAIAVGAMAGLLAAARRGGRVRRMWYAAVGGTAVAAFCYPHETVDVCRTVGNKARRTWDDFAKPPAPIRPYEVDGRSDMNEWDNDHAKNADMDMYSTRSTKIE